MQGRRDALQAAVQQYRAYLLVARQYELLSPQAAAMAEAALERHDEGEGDAGGSGRAVAAGLDPATLRQHKIDKFKRCARRASGVHQWSGGSAPHLVSVHQGQCQRRSECCCCMPHWPMVCRERAIKARLAELQVVEAGAGDADDASERGGSDAEERAREAWLLQLDLAGLQAAERVATTAQEVALLQHAASLSPEQRAAPPADAAEGNELLRALRDASATLFTSSRREQLRSNALFKPTVAQPTLSVEQQGEIELRQALEAQQRQTAAEERQRRREAEVHPDDKEEAELQKVRAVEGGGAAAARRRAGRLMALPACLPPSLPLCSNVPGKTGRTTTPVAGATASCDRAREQVAELAEWQQQARGVSEQ